MSTVEHNMYYIAGRIEDEETIVDLRDSLYTQTGAAIENYQRRTPHLTFVNQIKLPVHHEPTVTTQIDNSNPPNIPIEITGISVWPSLDNPRYVSLTVNADIEHYQNEFREVITGCGGDILTEPPQPHITLFKCENPNNISRRTREQLKQLEEKDLSIKTYIPYIDLLDDSLEPKSEPNSNPTKTDTTHQLPFN